MALFCTYCAMTHQIVQLILDPLSTPLPLYNVKPIGALPTRSKLFTRYQVAYHGLIKVEDIQGV